MSKRHWRVGELADATGLTVRTLHHYEQIGLLSPATRTEGRQRLYNDSDLKRLYCIRALRDMDLSLAEIGHILNNDKVMLGTILRSHLERVNAELDRLERLRGLLEHACAHEAQQTDPDVLATIEAMSQVVRHAEIRISTDAREDTEGQWRTLGATLRACLEAGESAASPCVRKIALEARALLMNFTGGDHAVLDALARLRKFAPPDNLAGWDPALFRFLDQALESLP